jgi:hypothetical protein
MMTEPVRESLYGPQTVSKEQTGVQSIMIGPEFGPRVLPTLAAFDSPCSWHWQPPGVSRTTCSSRTSKFVSAAMQTRNRPSVSRASRMSSRRKQTVCVGVVASPTNPSGAEAGEPSNHSVGPASSDLARSCCLNCAHSETNLATASLGTTDLQVGGENQTSLRQSEILGRRV